MFGDKVRAFFFCSRIKSTYGFMSRYAVTIRDMLRYLLHAKVPL